MDWCLFSHLQRQEESLGLQEPQGAGPQGLELGMASFSGPLVILSGQHVVDYWGRPGSRAPRICRTWPGTWLLSLPRVDEQRAGSMRGSSWAQACLITSLATSRGRTEARGSMSLGCGAGPTRGSSLWRDSQGSQWVPPPRTGQYRHQQIGSFCWKHTELSKKRC